MSYSRGTAYLLCAFAVFGIAGIHRFYLGRWVTGLLWLFTWGLCGIGTIIDLVRLPNMVANASARRLSAASPSSEPPDRDGKTAPVESIETVILRSAKANGGLVNPVEVAMGGDYDLEKTKACLDDLVSGGHAELRAKKSGGIVYVFPTLITPETENAIEPLT